MRCSNCGSLNADASVFCARCGSRLAASPPPLTSVAVEQVPFSERRLVSVVFVDLDGFTELAEGRDPEDVRSLQAEYFAFARSVVERYDGTIEKYIGDAVMAVWGATVAHEDDALRAIRAGLEIVAGVARLKAARDGLSARAAVTTGEAAVSPTSDGFGMVAGDLVNTAARLQQVAARGGVLVDDATRRLTLDDVDFVEVPPAELKGKSRPVNAWRAVGLRPAATTAGPALHPGPFVGREREFGELVGLYERVAAERRSRLVSVIGIAGIGKSRLAWELERALAGRVEAPLVLVGRCLSYGEGISFAPLAEMARRYGSSSAADTGSAAPASAGLADVLERLDVEATEREWLDPRLAALLEPAQQAYERDEAFAAWRRLFERMSAAAPLVLIFEDLQWADTALLDFIEYLASWSPDERLMLLTLARPELVDRRPGWGADQRSFTSLQLGRLDDTSMAALLRALLPDVDDDALTSVVRRSGGVPLYGVEVARMVRADGGLDIEQVPEGLHPLIAARVDALRAPARRLLLSAAVLGRRFEPEALGALHGLAPAAIREPLGLLIRRELLAVDEPDAFPNQGRLSFVQDVVRDVCYRTLSRSERRSLHLAAAARLERLDDASRTEELAEHLYRAYRALPGEAGSAELAERAAGVLRRAADRAFALHAPAEALVQLERALELVTADDHAWAELVATAAAAARAAGRFDVAEAQLRRLIKWHAERAESAALARARAELASLMLSTERHAAALAELQAALGDVPDIEADEAAVRLAGQLARGHVLAGNDRDGLEWATRTVAAARHLKLPDVAIDALITRGTARVRLGETAGGRADLRRAIAAAARRELLSAELRARNNLAWLMALEDPHEGLATARAGLELATRMGVGDMALQLALVVARLGLDTGDWDEALAVADDATRRPHAAAHRIGLVAVRTSLRALRGDDPAGELAALPSPDPDVDEQVLADVTLASAWVALVDARFTDAIGLARHAATQLIGSDRHEALALAGHAAAFAAEGAVVAEVMAALGSIQAHGRVSAASRLTLAAADAALNGSGRAPALYERAAGAWRALDLPLQLALCLAERAVLGGGERSELEAILERLSAAGLRRLVAATATR